MSAFDPKRTSSNPLGFGASGSVARTARTLPLEKREVFFQRVGAALKQRRGFNDHDVANAATSALRGLVQRADV
jgi:hypothetical protein